MSSPNVLSNKDVNISAMNQVNSVVEEKKTPVGADPHSMEYHRQVLQNKMQQNGYVLPFCDYFHLHSSAVLSFTTPSLDTRRYRDKRAFTNSSKTIGAKRRNMSHHRILSNRQLLPNCQLIATNKLESEYPSYVIPFIDSREGFRTASRNRTIYKLHVKYLKKPILTAPLQEHQTSLSFRKNLCQKTCRQWSAFRQRHLKPKTNHKRQCRRRYARIDFSPSNRKMRLIFVFCTVPVPLKRRISITHSRFVFGFRVGFWFWVFSVGESLDNDEHIIK